MTVYKKVSPATGKVSWFCTFYYKDYQGQRHQKKKEGFSTQREAKEFEREYLALLSGSPDMLFKDLVKNYQHDREQHDKQSTSTGKNGVINNAILPFFQDMPLNEITPAAVRLWINELAKRCAPSTVGVYKGILSAIFNYACRLYGLKTNPVRLAGAVDVKKKKHRPDMQIWTPAQFNAFIRQLDQARTAATPIYKILFPLLFYSGIRISEALAITPADIDTAKGTININKRLYRIKGKDTISTPKTPAGNRIITLPPSIVQLLGNYISTQQGRMTATDRLFPLKRTAAFNFMQRWAAAAGLPLLRLHDLRHSHASLLIEKGFSPIAIRDRLGHEDIQTTLQTYGHLYPNKQGEIATALQNIINENVFA